MEHIWLEQYPPGVPADITEEAAGYDSLLTMLEESCQRYSKNVAYISMGAELTYGQVNAHSRRFAAWLQSVGVKKGDRVAIMMPNLLQYPVCLFGILRAGAVAVGINPLFTASELEHQLADSGAETVVIAENFAHTLQKAMPNLHIKHVVVTSIGDLLGPVRGILTDVVVRHVRKLVPPYDLPGALPFRHALSSGRDSGYTRPSIDADDLALLQYTGGTTGVAKAAMLTHGNLVANVCQAHAWVQPYVKGEQECIVTALPLYHIFALTANCLTFFRMGARNLLILNARDIPALVKTMSETRFTAITGVNTLFNALLNNPDFAKLDFSNLHISLGGGMAVQEVVAQRWLDVTGTPLAQAYGLTETSPAVSINPLDKHEFTGSIGLPVPSTDIAIRDNEGRDQPLGETGEICVRGPQVTRGYWQRPDETTAAFTADGFFMTGDIGLIDHDGYLYIRDRKKDMILVSGFNVYPNEVEAVAVQHPDVLEAAAVGVASEHSGEAVKLFVIRKNDRLTERELIDFCRDKLTGYKLPRQVEFRDELPRSSVGKILRRALKDELKNSPA